MIIIVMGVSGSGKSTIGKMLAEKMSLPFFDADDYHSLENISKMKKGKPLEDADREEWLHTLHKLLLHNKSKGAVLACSALKEKYRTTLTGSLQDVKWVFLKGAEAMIKKRIEERTGHYMNASLIKSQFDSLEEPNYGIHADIKIPPALLVEEILMQLK